MVLWALNDSGYQIYSNPEIRIGFVFWFRTSFCR
jgi:hypothetical protein